MHRYFVTGTDTDVGKTRVAAALARALVLARANPTVVKVVQTGLPPDVPGDAARAGELAGCPFAELVRFEKPADPHSAALAAGRPAPRAAELAAALAAIPGGLVAEGSGGIMVPLNADEHFGHLALSAGLETVMVVGLRLGCINHALLTAGLCKRLRIRLVGAVLVERWGPTAIDYRDDVARALQGKLRVLGILPFAPDETRAGVESAATLFEPLVNR